MRTEIESDKAVGRTVEGFWHSAGQVVICLDGDTFTTFGIAHGWWRMDDEIVNEKLDFENRKLVGAGITSQQELDAMRAESEERRRQKVEQWEQLTYQRLKTKFGEDDD